MFGSEYYFNKVQSSVANDRVRLRRRNFAAYLFTGEVHPYNENGAFFGPVSPDHSVYKGGLGAEGVLRFSYVDMDSGTITGGKFWRATPMVNWYLSDNVRFELVYGYGRFESMGAWQTTQFLQSRFQFTLD